MDYDIVILGAGPAGSVFAGKIDGQKYRVLIIDKKNDTADSFEKCCGGLLSERAQKEMKRLGYEIPQEIKVSPQVSHIKTHDFYRNITVNYPKHYINTDRVLFDRWLISLIPENITVIKGCVGYNIQKNDTGFTLNLRHDNGSVTKVSTKYIVGADGANSQVRNFIFPHSPIRYQTAIQQWFSIPDKHEFSCLFDEETNSRCSWTITKNNQYIFGGAFDSHNARKRFEAQKKYLGLDKCNPLKTEACMVLCPQKWNDFKCGTKNVFLIGEAGGFISSGSYEGISSAFYTGNALAQVINQSDKNILTRYKRATLIWRLMLWIKLSKSFVMHTPICRTLVMKSKISADRTKE